MSRYIDVTKQLVRLYRLNLDCENVIKEFLITAEPEEVAERKKGKWKYGVCQTCFFDWSGVAPFANVPNFCPNCGAKMESEEKDV